MNIPMGAIDTTNWFSSHLCDGQLEIKPSSEAERVCALFRDNPWAMIPSRDTDGPDPLIFMARRCEYGI